MTAPTLLTLNTFNGTFLPFTTSAWSKTAGLLTLALLLQQGGADPIAPDFSSPGDGCTWVSISDFPWATSDMRISAFRTVPSSSGSVTTTFSGGGFTESGGVIYLLSFDGTADATGTQGANGIITVQPNVAFGTTMTCTVPSFGGVTGSTLFFAGITDSGSPTLTAGGGVTNQDYRTGGSTAEALAWADGEHNSPSYVSNGSANWNMCLGIGIRAAGAVDTPELFEARTMMSVP
jgi:hypothetical protein